MDKLPQANKRAKSRAGESMQSGRPGTGRIKRHLGYPLISACIFLSVCSILSIHGLSYADSIGKSQAPTQSEHSADKNVLLAASQKGQSDDLGSVRSIDGHDLDLTRNVRGKEEDSGEFVALEQERRWVLDVIRVLEDKLSVLEAQKQSHQKPNPIPTIGDNEYNVKVSEIDAKVREDEKIQSDLSRNDGDKLNAQLELVELTRQRARLDLRLEESRDYDQQLADYQNLTQQVSETRRLFAAAQHYLSIIDEEISKTLLERHADNQFRMLMGGAFTILAAALIVGFYVIARAEPNLRRMFLSNDRGLQFIALFSLIIAITLFGLMNILGSRELSALLGGLAGYILGRSNLGQDGQRPATEGGAPNRPPPADDAPRNEPNPANV